MRDPLLIISYLFISLSFSWELILFAILFLPVVGFLIGSIVKRLRHPARRGQEQMGEMVTLLDESLGGIKMVKSYNATEYTKGKYNDINSKFTTIILSMARKQQRAEQMREFLGLSAVAIVWGWGGMVVFEGGL